MTAHIGEYSQIAQVATIQQAEYGQRKAEKYVRNPLVRYYTEQDTRSPNDSRQR